MPSHLAVLDVQTVFWLLAGIQSLGVASAFMVRLGKGSRGESSFHGLFFACLGLVGLATMLSLAAEANSWLPCSATLALMILVAVWDFGPTAVDSSWDAGTAIATKVTPA